MPPEYENVYRLAMELSYEERQKLSEALWWSLHPPAEDLPQEQIDAAWAAEIERRIADIDSGKEELIPAEQVMAELRDRLSGARANRKTKSRSITRHRVR